MATRPIRWAAWTAADVLVRLAALGLGTVIASHFLGPHEFGVAALALTISSLASVCVGAPFEDALALGPKRRLRHFRAALGLSLLAAIVFSATSAGIGFALAAVWGEPDLGPTSAAAALAVFLVGPGDVLTALARRRRRFGSLAAASMAAHVIALAVSITAAVAGAGVWALILQRLVLAGVRLAVLALRAGTKPAWSFEPIRDLLGFAKISFFDRASVDLGYFLFNAIVEARYGAEILGCTNLAMRIVEPLRGTSAAAVHNLGSGLLNSTAAAQKATTQAARLLAPVFFGIAAVVSPLIAVALDPRWAPAAPIAVGLALGASIAAPVQMILAAFAARSRPEVSLRAGVVGLITSLLALLLAGPLGPVGVGLARLLGDFARALVAILARDSEWTPASRFRALGAGLAPAALMAALVAAIAWDLPPAASSLALSAAFGAAVYLGVLAAADRFSPAAVHPHRARRR